MNIETVGRSYKEQNNATGNDYLVGLEKITVNYEKIQDILMSNIIFKGQYFISVPVDEDLSNIKWMGRDHDTRQAIYAQCDLLMTSNP